MMGPHVDGKPAVLLSIVLPAGPVDGGGGPGPAGSVVTAEFELDGQRFMALNGGPAHTFSEGISLFVSVASQEELDHYWDQLLAGAGGAEAMLTGGRLDDDDSWEALAREALDLLVHRQRPGATVRPLAPRPGAEAA
jgi:3-demethylubiquinone-9 3-methyltransferase